MVDTADLFVGGPPLLVQTRLGLVRPGHLHVGLRCGLFVVLAWVIPCVLAGFEGNLLPRTHGIALSQDIATFARCAIAGPLLITADAISGMALSVVVYRFADMCHLSPSPADDVRFESIVQEIRKLRDAPLAELACIVLAYLASFAIEQSMPPNLLPEWHLRTDGSGSLSFAGWWYVAVSLPMLLAHLFGWLWRLAVWTRFLILTSRLELALIPVHPDRCAGLGFLSLALRSLAPIGAALGAIVAGAIANQVLFHGASIFDFKFAPIVTAVVAIVLLAAPLCAFSARLLGARRRGEHQYGLLATAFGRQFEKEWLAERRPLDKSVLERGDFSSATDLYQVVDRVSSLRLVPTDLLSVATIAIATLVPFAPVVLMVLPIDVIVHAVVGLLR